MSWLKPGNSENVVAGTGSNSLKNLATTASAVGVLVENSTRRNRFCALEFKWTLATGSTTAGFGIYIIPTFDGTNFATDNVLNILGNVVGKIGDTTADILETYSGILVAVVKPVNDTSAHRVIIPGIVVPPLDFKFYVYNGTGQSTANTDSASIMNAIFYNDRIRTY